MKKIRKIACGLMLPLIGLVAAGFAACGADDPASANQNGADGQSAYEIWLEQGFTGSEVDFLEWLQGQNGLNGSNGADGADGQSAYEIWLKNGYTGSEADFLEWLCGDDGKNGVGIKSVEINADGEFVVYDTEGNVLYKKKLPLCTHAYSETAVGLEPTCTSAGFRWRECSKCGEKDYEILPATGHTWYDGTVVLQADCIRNGFLYYTCIDCGITKMETIEATGEHRFENGVCVFCNQSHETILDSYYNDDYGYQYLGSLEKGAGLCGLYDAIDKEVMAFHSDAAANAELAGGFYLLSAFDYTEYGLAQSEAVSVWKTYLDDNPLYYWLSKSLTVSGDTIGLNVEADYAVGSVRAEYNAALYERIEEYLPIAEGESAYTVALAYHDAIIGKIDYAYKNGGNQPEDAAWAHNITGVFEERGAVCEGYARAFQLLLNARGIQNVFVTGTSRNQNHAWNLVKLDDGEWYWYDLTWDDTPNYYWGTSHTYFCATDAEFLKTHVVASSSAWGVNFLCELPARAAAEYAGEEILYYDEITVEGTDYVVVGYDTVNLSFTAAGGEYAVPETVSYGGREFTVVSLMHFENGKPSTSSVLSSKIKFVSVFIPKTVVYINDNALRCSGSTDLEEIFVDEENPRFCSQDGVLFSTGLYTLITYPQGRAGTEYSIPDETVYIAYYAFSGTRSALNLQTLVLGRNLDSAGVANWGNGYPDETHRAYNFIGGEWGRILRCMSGAARIVVGENPYFKVTDGMLLNSAETRLYAVFPDTERAEVPETVTRIDSAVFNECSVLKEVILPEGLPSIDSFMFYNCRSLKTIVIPETVTSIGRSAFMNCTSLESIFIPKNVTSIGYGVFQGCTALKTVAVAEENTTFAVKGNCLVNLVTKTLVSGTNDSVIPDDGSIETIEEYAFYGCREITEIVVPEGVTSIGSIAFGNCVSLKTLVLPESLALVGTYIFLNVYNVNVFYRGTCAQWEAVEKEGAFYEHSTVYCYSEIMPTETGNFWHYVNGVPTVW